MGTRLVSSGFRLLVGAAGRGPSGCAISSVGIAPNEVYRAVYLRKLGTRFGTRVEQVETLVGSEVEEVLLVECDEPGT